MEDKKPKNATANGADTNGPEEAAGLKLTRRFSDELQAKRRAQSGHQSAVGAVAVPGSADEATLVETGNTSEAREASSIHHLQRQAKTEAQIEENLLDIVARRASNEAQSSSGIHQVAETTKKSADIDSMNGEKAKTVARAILGDQAIKKDAFRASEEINLMDIVANRAGDGASNNYAVAPLPNRRQHEPMAPGAYSGGPGGKLRRNSNARFSLVGVRPDSKESVVSGGEEEEPTRPAPTTVDQPIPSNTPQSDDPPLPASFGPRASQSDSNLVEAREVTGLSSRFDLTQEAREVDPESLEKKVVERRRNNQILFGAFSLLVIALAALFGTILGRQSTSKSAEPDITFMPSEAPTQSPSEAPTGALDVLMMGLPESTLEKLESISTPQWKAFDWLQHHPHLGNLEEWRKKQLFALATFFYSMDGENWPDIIKDGWLDYEKSECVWFDTSQGEFYGSTGTWVAHNFYGNKTVCNELGEYQMLDLAGLELGNGTAMVPPEFVFLTSLSILSLPRNQINASLDSLLSTEIYHMELLTDLYLDENGFTGTLPSQLGLLTKVADLYFPYNSFTGSIPTELGMMTSMSGLYLEYNSLSGQIPSQLGLMTCVMELYMTSNTLSGEIPSELGQMATCVTDLYLDSNTLTGSTPSQLGLMTTMKRLYLSDNSLTGSLPSELALITDLGLLRLHNNSFTGTIPLNLDQLAINGSLVSLTLANNSISGTIPESLCSLGLFHPSLQIGLSFDCSEQLCGCCWCPCPGSNYTGECRTLPFDPLVDDTEWPGDFPSASNAITINIRTDEYPEENAFEWSRQDESGFWNLLDQWAPSEPSSVHSYTKGVESDSLYKLHVFDEYADGTCCAFGLGWFTITEFTSFGNHSEGVVWEATGDVMDSYTLDLYIWIDSDGNATVYRDSLI